MRQTGKVVDVKDDFLVLSVVRDSACGESCASCSSKCSLKNTTATADKIIGVNKGDTVEFEMSSSKVMWAAFLVYITPLIVLMLGYIIAVLLGISEGRSVLVGIIAMAFWFFVVHFIDKKLSKHYKHTIVKKIEGDN